MLYWFYPIQKQVNAVACDTPKESSSSPAPYVVYLLRCRDGSLYCGITNDIEKRLAAHNSGNGAKYTKSRRPVTLVYKEDCVSKSDALKREYAVKQLTHAEKEQLIRNRGI